MLREQKDFERVSLNGTTILVRKDLPQKRKEELYNTLRLELLSNSVRKKNLVVPLTDSPPVFCKLRALPRIKYKLKATATAMGLSQACPAITEIVNNLSMAHLGYVPGMLAYGYKRNRCGLISETAIATEFLGQCINLGEYLDLHPEKSTATIMAALEFMGKKLEDDVLHLDFWLGNVLIDPHTGKLWLIDLEYCRFRSEAAMEDKLAFCLGYFYHYRLGEYMTAESYFDLARSWLTQNFSDEVYAANILTRAERSLSNMLRRKERMATFKATRRRPSIGGIPASL